MADSSSDALPRDGFAIGDDGRARVTASLDGTPLRDVRPRGVALLRGVGELLAAIEESLAPLDGAAFATAAAFDLDRELARARSRPRDPRDRDEDAIERHLDAIEGALPPLWATLPRGVVPLAPDGRHLLVHAPLASDPAPAGLLGCDRVGLAVRVTSPAVALAAVVRDAADPLTAAAALVRGFSARRALAEPEVDALFPLALLHLVLAATATEDDGDALSARRTLARLEAVRPALARATLRHAAGLEPCARAPLVCDRLAALVKAPVLPFPLRTLPLVSLAVDAPTPPELLPARAVGRYDEARLCYTTPAYAEPADDLAESRTVHLGVDLFAEAGTEVRAPLEGVVHSLRDNDRPLDYGPTILLRHDLGDGLEVVTLYGHLARASLEGLAPGRPVRRGETFARVGAEDENGGWAPHLHFQVIADDLGLEGDFPGAAAPRRREVFLSICPDPALLLDLPPGARAPRDASGAQFVRRDGPEWFDAAGRVFLDAASGGLGPGPMSDLLAASLHALAARHASLTGVAVRDGPSFSLAFVSPPDGPPAWRFAAHAGRRLREKGVLLSEPAPGEGLLVVAPPPGFQAAHAERLLGALDAVLGEAAFRVS